MSDLESREAFEIVLDKLVEEGRSRTADVEKRLDAEMRREQAVRDLDRVRSELETARARLLDFSGADEAMIELYKAIDSAAVKLTNAGETRMSEYLRDRVVAAKKFIDPIPF